MENLHLVTNLGQDMLISVFGEKENFLIMSVMTLILKKRHLMTVNGISFLYQKIFP